MTRKKKQYRIMRRFKLNEISAVDLPAQEDARAVITKARDVGHGCIVIGNHTSFAKRMDSKTKAKPKKQVEMKDLAGNFDVLTDEERELLGLIGVDTGSVSETPYNEKIPKPIREALESDDNDDERKTAMQDASFEALALFEKYSKRHGARNAGLITARKLHSGSVDNASSFQKKVDEIYRSSLAKSANSRRRPSRTEAMAKARKLYPLEFKLFQARADQPELRR